MRAGCRGITVSNDRRSFCFLQCSPVSPGNIPKYIRSSNMQKACVEMWAGWRKLRVLLWLLLIFHAVLVFVLCSRSFVSLFPSPSDALLHTLASLPGPKGFCFASTFGLFFALYENNGNGCVQFKFFTKQLCTHALASTSSRRRNNIKTEA